MPKKSSHAKLADQSSLYAKRNDREVAGWKIRLVEAMKERGLSQRKLALASGMGATSMRYLVADAETLSVETAKMICNALNIPMKQLVTGENIIIERGGDLTKRIAVLAVNGRNENEAADDQNWRGVVAFPVETEAKHLHAFLQDDRSMEPRGSNEITPPDNVVAQGDVVVWTKDIDPKPGTLAIMRERGAISGDGRLSVRRLMVDLEGRLQAIANNIDYGRFTPAKEDILGTVLFIQRVIERD